MSSEPLGSGDWIGVAALLVSALTALYGFFVRYPMTSASRVEELREKLKDLQLMNESFRDTNRQLSARIAQLEQQVTNLRADAEYWQTEFRKLRQQRMPPRT